MSRLKEVFKNLKNNNKKAFSPFLMSGYPDMETCLNLMHISANQGADFIELGMPFSDPSADGPIIKAAGEHSLKNGTTIKKTIELVREFRKTNSKTSLVWMGYFNSLFNYGIEKFFLDISNAGVDGVLIVDLPFEEYFRIEVAKNYDIDIIRMISPTTSNERILKVLEDASGFIYFVSIAGITGTKKAQGDLIKETVEYIKTKTDIPVMVGFGIKDSKSASLINSFADGSIVGSALISKITSNLDDKKTMLKEAEEFLSEFK